MFRCLLLFTTLLVVSCLGPRKYTPLTYFDLGTEEFNGVKLNIGNIHQDGPYKSRMVKRVSSGMIQLSEFQRWTQAPDLMTTHYLKKCFEPGGEYTLEGEIITFENDLSKGKALFTFHYKITKGGNTLGTGFFRQEQESGPEAEDFANSMSILAKKLTAEIAGKIKTFK
jgi:hypothetical protein